MSSLVIGLSGPIASGKTTIAAALAERFGFIHLRSSRVLARLLEERGEQVTEGALQAIGKELVESIGGRGLSALVLADYDPSRNYVYDSIRHVEDCGYFRERFGERFHLLYIEAPEITRKKRYLLRSDRDSSEAGYHRRISHPVEHEVPLLQAEASAVVVNDNLDSSLEQIGALIHVWAHDGD